MAIHVEYLVIIRPFVSQFAFLSLPCMVSRSRTEGEKLNRLMSGRMDGRTSSRITSANRITPSTEHCVSLLMMLNYEHRIDNAWNISLSSPPKMYRAVSFSQI